MVITFWDSLMFDPISLSPQVKRGVIISNEHGIIVLRHEEPKIRKVWEIRKFEENLKTL